jgi:S1-C subfamily serine protease
MNLGPVVVPAQEPKPSCNHAERFEITYPTLRKRLDGVIGRLEEERRRDQEKIEDILHRMEQGDIDAEEGVGRIEEMKPTVADNNCRWCLTFGEDMAIVAVDEGSVGEEMGLKEGDKIVEVDGKESPSMRWLFDYMYGVEAGNIVAITVLRDGSRLTFSHTAPPKL